VLRHTYDRHGRLHTIVKPDGVVLTHTYDLFGRLLTLTSSDETIHYTYTYDLKDNVLSATDEIHQTTTLRDYDTEGRLTHETLSNGLAMVYDYDSLGRVTHVTLPDESGVSYCYDGIHLALVSRLNAQAESLYAHHYSNYDWRGLEQERKLMGNAPSLKYEYDLLGRSTAISSTHWSQINSYDSIGNLIESDIHDPIEFIHSAYSYDDLNQLIEETGHHPHTYVLDSLNNRLGKDGLPYQVNGINQVKDDSQSSYTYDANGNRLQKTSPSGSLSYTYDGLNRLTQVSCEAWTVQYSYDSFGRRLTKTLQEDDSTTTTAFVYQGSIEIGAMKDGQFEQLRILGRGKGADIGAAVAIELQEGIYAPIHDHRGNICCLLDSDSGLPIEFYRYTAYGELTRHETPTGNPWRFASKRWDPHTDLYNFCKRDYDSNLGRWLTPDPNGYADGPNLYAYTHNRPLILIDPWGLEGQSLYDRNRAEASSRRDGNTHRNYSTRDSGSSREYSPLVSICDNLLGRNILNHEGSRKVLSRLAHESLKALHDLLRPCERLSEEINLVPSTIPGSFLNSSPRECLDDKVARAHQFLDQVFSTDFSSSYTPEAYQGITLATLPLPVLGCNKCLNSVSQINRTSRLLTRTSIKDYLGNVNKLSREQIISDLESIGLKLKENIRSRAWMEFIDRRGNIRVKIHPPDRNTSYNHLHIYDKNGKSLDAQLKIVNHRSIEAHIEYGGDI
jgi:RHS repeat-associated protein